MFAVADAADFATFFDEYIGQRFHSRLLDIWKRSVNRTMIKVSWQDDEILKNIMGQVSTGVGILK